MQLNRIIFMSLVSLPALLCWQSILISAPVGTLPECQSVPAKIGQSNKRSRGIAALPYFMHNFHLIRWMIECRRPFISRVIRRVPAELFRGGAAHLRASSSRAARRCHYHTYRLQPAPASFISRDQYRDGMAHRRRCLQNYRQFSQIGP